jgi:hypothetical protein
MCNGSTGEVIVVFGGGWSSALNVIRTLISEYLTNELDSLLCQLTVLSTRLLGDEISSHQRTYEQDDDVPHDDDSETIIFVRILRTLFQTMRTQHHCQSLTVHSCVTLDDWV